MLFRRNILPRSISEISSTILVLSFVPITFVFELFVVIPDVHNGSDVFFWFYGAIGVVVVFNILGNMLASMLVDTSIKGSILTPPSRSNDRKLWRFCYDCETLSPPRSWHCSTCNTCILKRDHHCLFTGYCVGHHNQRYFVWFLAYLLLGSAFTTLYNSYYFWYLHATEYLTRDTALSVLLPMLMFTLSSSWSNFYLLIYGLNVFTFVYTLILAVLHVPVVLRGSIMHERRADDKYDLGWRGNLRMVMGNRWQWTWASPFISSELPHDGIHWEQVLKQTEKSR